MEEGLIKKISRIISERFESSEKALIALGAKKNTIEKALKGEFIMDCPQCKTFNLYEVIDEKEIKWLEGKVDLEKYGKDISFFYCNECEDYAVHHRVKK